jgi:hypothetical protein
VALCLHGCLHHSQDLPLETRCQPEACDRGTRKFLRLFNARLCRGDDSVDADTCKIHCHLHTLQNMLMFGDLMQHDAAKGERGLKDWAKLMSQTAQKCGIGIFLFQTIHRVATHQLMQRAQPSDLWRKRRLEWSREGFENNAKEGDERAVMNHLTPHFRHSAESKGLCSLDRRLLPRRRLDSQTEESFLKYKMTTMTWKTLTSGVKCVSLPQIGMERCLLGRL